MTVLTATVAATLSLRVCTCFSSQPSSQGDHGGCFPRCLLLQAARHGLCVTCQHTSHKVTFPGQAAQDRRYQQPVAHALCCSIGAAARVNVDSSSRCGAVFPSVPGPITSPSGDEGDIVELLDDDGWPDRGALRNSRKTHVTLWCVLLLLPLQPLLFRVCGTCLK